MSAFDSEKIASRNVLGLYSSRRHTDTLNWCILYNGTEEDGIHLAEMIADACANMSSSSYKQMIASGKYATTMVRLLHSAMKPGTDGPVIKIEDVDQAKLRRLAADV